jgi:uncharacterized alkaline shock family protein YloU
MSPVPDLPDADAVAAAVASCPSVVGLSGGFAGEIATYLPGRRVSGIRTNPDSVEVHVIAKYGAELHQVESQVRGAVTAAVGEAVRIDVVLADVEDPFAPDEEEEQEPLALEAGPTAALPAASGSETTSTTGQAGASAPGAGQVTGSGAGSTLGAAAPGGTAASGGAATSGGGTSSPSGNSPSVGSPLPTPPAP